MKTPDESKCGMECMRTNAERICVKPEKGQCPRCEQIVSESLARIRQLESRLAQVEKERDAALYDMNQLQGATCAYCKNLFRTAGASHVQCREFGDLSKFSDDENYNPLMCGRFEWRGLCPENTQDPAKE